MTSMIRYSAVNFSLFYHTRVQKSIMHFGFGICNFSVKKEAAECSLFWLSLFFDLFGLVDELDFAVHLVGQTGVGLVVLGDIGGRFQAGGDLAQVAVFQ